MSDERKKFIHMDDRDGTYIDVTRVLAVQEWPMVHGCFVVMEHQTVKLDCIYASEALAKITEAQEKLKGEV